MTFEEFKTQYSGKLWDVEEIAEGVLEHVTDAPELYSSAELFLAERAFLIEELRERDFTV
jgi:hypothetical protein